MLFDLGGKAEVFHVAFKRAGVHLDAGVLDLLRAGRDVDELDLPVERLGDLDARLDAVAAGRSLRAAHAHLDGVAFPDGRADLVDDEQQKAHPVV